MRTLEFDAISAVMSEELPGPDLQYYRPTCEIRWAHKKDFPGIKQDYPHNLILIQKYECRFPEKSWDPIWVPVGFLE